MAVSRKVLGEIAPNVEGKKAGKTIEEMYQKKSQLEHILLRPDSYSASPRPKMLVPGLCRGPLLCVSACLSLLRRRASAPRCWRAARPA